MSTYDYVNSTGLTYFWGKIKAYVASLMPTKVSDLPNDAGYITGYTETDPTVPSWAKAASKPSYTASEVGADASGTAASAVSTHNSSSSAHSDIRAAIPTNVSDLTNDAGYTTNAGTITGITMNGASKGTSGVVDLGTVITAHQDISGKLDKSGGTMTGALTLNADPTSNLHAATKQYVDSHAGTGDMLKSVYDTDNNGIVDYANYAYNAGSASNATQASMASAVYDSYNQSLTGILFGLDANGKGVYKATGASTWTPFLSKNWDAVAFICGNGSKRNSESFTVLNRHLWGADPDYFDDPVEIGSSEPAISLICKQAGTYMYSYFARGSNNSNANFRVVKNDTTYETISGAPNAGTDGGNTITLAVGDVVNITARNASNSTAAYSFSLYMFLATT